MIVHGQSFLDLLVYRFRRGGLYLLDEPEAALSIQGCLAAITRIHDLVQQGSQFLGLDRARRLRRRVAGTRHPPVPGRSAATVGRCLDDGSGRMIAASGHARRSAPVSAHAHDDHHRPAAHRDHHALIGLITNGAAGP
jgi:hypothetical protein